MLALGLQVAGAGLLLYKTFGYAIQFYIQTSLKITGYMKRVGASNYDKDLIYLHQFPTCEAKQVHCVSPFAIKLETWLRLHKLKYQIVETWQFSKQHTIPYIFFNGEEIPDSDYIIPFLAKHFNIDITYGLSDYDQAISLAFFRLVEDHLAWTAFYFRYVQNADLYAKVFSRGFSRLTQRFFKWLIKKNVAIACFLRGFGRRTSDEIAEASCNDIRALSCYLGDKNYLCGEKMTTIDCDVFGHLSQIIEVKSMPYPQRNVMESECQNLLRYFDRIKMRLWPDWHSIIPQGEFDN